jgi:hypothetical protein
MLTNKLHELQFCNSIVYMVQFIAIQLQLYQNNSFSTIIQLNYNYTHDVLMVGSKVRWREKKHVKHMIVCVVHIL